MYLCYRQNFSSNGSGSIMFRASNDNGVNFAPAVRIRDKVGLTTRRILAAAGSNALCYGQTKLLMVQM